MDSCGTLELLASVTFVSCREPAGAADWLAPLAAADGLAAAPDAAGEGLAAVLAVPGGASDDAELAEFAPDGEAAEPHAAMARASNALASANRKSRASIRKSTTLSSTFGEHRTVPRPANQRQSTLSASHESPA
jgi:hypothetical protein